MLRLPQDVQWGSFRARGSGKAGLSIVMTREPRQVAPAAEPFLPLTPKAGRIDDRITGSEGEACIGQTPRACEQKTPDEFTDRRRLLNSGAG
jgi:hypothetical protein